jgi:hypothetical protein
MDTRRGRNEGLSGDIDLHPQGLGTAATASWVCVATSAFVLEEEGAVEGGEHGVAARKRPARGRSARALAKPASAAASAASMERGSDSDDGC